MLSFRIVLLVLCCVAQGMSAGNGNRFAYLDQPVDPYYVGPHFPKLITPQWVGEPGVDCVVVLAIDDMRDPEKYEQFLRPILARLQQIDGRAPVSIMTNQIDPKSPRVQQWLAEGLGIDVHTIDHPCPLLMDGDFAKAKGTYDRCVDLLSEIRGGQPVAFRMPCCDSLNSPSPRFWTEIFDRVTPRGRFLQIDSSVFNVLSPARSASNDPDLAAPRPDFQRYIPFPSFVNTIENYPYPYVIGRMCWEFPCVVPSDWEAQHLHGPNNPETVLDLQAALDLTVQMKGVFDLVFHPHAWIRNDQVIELIDHAVNKYGRHVKFLTFRECLDRLNRHLLAGTPLRRPDGDPSGVRLLDINNDGFIDVLQPEASGPWISRVWSPSEQSWHELPTPIHSPLVRFGVLDANSQAGVLLPNSASTGFQIHVYTADGWQSRPLAIDGDRVSESLRRLLLDPLGFDGIVLRDLDGDGICEILLATQDESFVLLRSHQDERWFQAGFTLPDGVTLVGADGTDSGLRLFDIDHDGDMDCLFSSPSRYSLHLFESRDTGWSQAISSAGQRIAPFVRADGTNNGAWIHSDHLWFQNEDTSRLPDHVDRVALRDLAQSAVADGKVFPDPLSPEESLAAIRTGPEVRVELVASEPLVMDPVALDWGPDGRLWVVEMRDYPNGMDGKGAAGGRVKVLYDDNQDGRYDRAKVFLDGLPFPSGLKVWRNGILITVAPNIVFAVDNNGDDIADQTEILYRGFPESNQQHRVNGLQWGMDGWLYLGTGDGDGTIESVKTGEKTSVGGRDLRIRPDDGGMQTVSGQTQFGRCSDDWGNWFGGNNSEPIWHYVLDDNYLKRNPHYAHPTVRREISDQPGAAPVYSASRLLPRFNDFDRSNRFTSACSPTFYRDSLIGDPPATYTYVCEPVHNLVHREIVEPRGVTFASHRPAAERHAEFFASTDNWCRPVVVKTGPDGAIWVADMYRLVIEHPTWIPESWQRQVDVRAGDDRGRLYRVVPRDEKLRPTPNFSQLSTSELVQLLNSPNGCQRDIAQQLLVWRNDKAACDPLRQLLASTHPENPRSAIPTLFTLDLLGGLDEGLLVDVIARADWRVARHAVQLAERFLRQSRESGLGPAIVKRLRAESAHLPFVQQVAYTLGEWNSPESAIELADLAVAHQREEYILASVMSSINSANIRPVLARIKRVEDRATIGPLIAELASAAVLIGDSAAVEEAISVVAVRTHDPPAAWQLEAASDMLAALDSRSGTLDNVADTIRRSLQPLVSSARRIITDDHQTTAHRLLAVRLWGNVMDLESDELAPLAAMLNPRHPPELQRSAVEALTRKSNQQVTELLLRDWKSHAPQLRADILDQLLSRTESTRQVLTAIETGLISVDDLNAQRRRQIHASPDVSNRSLAERLLPLSSASSRGELVRQFTEAITMPGDPDRGRAHFRKHCATCHFLEEMGNRIGPDLVALTNKSPDAMLTAILDPNRAVEDHFLEYIVITNDGRQFSGMLLDESSTTVTLFTADGKRHAVTRDQLDSITATNKSLMPEGFEKELPASAMADLLSYVSSYSIPRKEFPGNEPRLADVRDDGSIRLFAIHASIYGPTIQFEQQYRNLGYWQSAEDQAVWEIDVPQAGKFTVHLDYACDDSVAGNRYVFTVNDQTLTGRVEGTYSWDNYSGKTIGALELPEGRVTAVFKPDGPVNQALIDLRTIILEPVEN